MNQLHYQNSAPKTTKTLQLASPHPIKGPCPQGGEIGVEVHTLIPNWQHLQTDHAIEEGPQ